MASHASDAPTHGKLTDNAGVLAAPIPPLTLTSSAVAVDSDTASTKEKDDTTATPPPEKGLDGEGDDGEDETEYVTGWKLFSLMAAVTLASFLMLLDMSIIVTAIPRITTYFHSLPDVGWYGAAYNLSSAALQPISGKFYTYFKTKWMFLSFLLLFEVGSLLCGVANSSTMLIIGRAVAGVGTSGIQNGGLTIIAAAAPLERRPVLIGIVMGVCQLGIAAGPLIGGALTEYTTWRWCFYINLPIGGLAALVIILVNIPDRRFHKPSDLTWSTVASKFDFIGFLLFAPWAIMIMLALEWGGNKYAWNSAKIIGLLCGGGVLFIVFVIWEMRVGEGAMIPLPILRKRQILAACLTSVFFFMTVFGASYYLPIYFQSVKGASPFMSGVYVLPSILPQLVTAVIGGFTIQKVGYYLPFAVGSSVLICIATGLFTLLKPDTPTATWAGIQVLSGIGRGMAMQVAILALQTHSPPAVLAATTATLIFGQTFSGALFISIANSIFTNKLRSELTQRIPSIPADTIIAAGATGVRKLVSPDLLLAAEWAYSKAIQNVFYFAIAASICLLFATMNLGWTDIRKKKKKGVGSGEP